MSQKPTLNRPVDCCDGGAGRRRALALLAGFGLCAETVLAQDPVKTEPRSYRVVLENDKVRVLEYIARPGLGVCGSGVHSHPDHVSILLTDAKMRVVGDDGKPFVTDVKAGDVIWEPASTHEVENIGGRNSRVLMVEIKDRSWRPSTG
jgi:quercetin dioxygenase-like cupin family protein